MARKKKEDKEKRYIIELNARQLYALENCCEMYGRMLVGQEMPFKELFEQAWEDEVRKPGNLEPTGEEFWDMRREVSDSIDRIKKLCFDIQPRANWGVGHNEKADVLFDMYHTFMYRRWTDMKPESKELMRNTVMSNPPMRYSKEPLPVVRLIEESDN